MRTECNSACSILIIHQKSTFIPQVAICINAQDSFKPFLQNRMAPKAKWLQTHFGQAKQN
uniref:Uncharacterized protein n=1 Tax=Rhizophora mucronata TaxID=61149 RepID=A0A2P2PJR0_RHIMU